MNNLFARLVDCRTNRLVLTFFVLDIFALSAAWLYRLDVLTSRFFRLGRDRGLCELMEYGKFGLIIFMLLAAWQKYREPVMRAWVILFSIMLADNLIGIHEEVGKLLLGYIVLPELSLETKKHLAEVLVLMFLEGSALLYVIYSYFKSGPKARVYSHWLIGVFSIFAFFSLIVDAVGPEVMDAFSRYLLEEIGEMISLTLILAWVHYRHRTELSADSSAGVSSIAKDSS